MSERVTGPTAGPAADLATGPVTLDRIRLSVLEEPLEDPVPMSIGVLRARCALLVEVVADGVHGVGEVWVNHPAWACRERLLTFRHGIVPLLGGRDVGDPAALLAGLAEALLPRAEQAGAVGPVWQALSGLDLALWDLLGRRHGLPVARLLGDVVEPSASVPVYASGIGPTRVEELCERAREQGMGAVKARLGFGERTDTTTLRAIRATLGDDVELYADANRAWGSRQAREMSAVLRDFGVAWIEEPLHEDGADELAGLAEETGLPVASGENLYGAAAFEHCLSHARLAVIQPDPAKSGGLTTTAAVARSAAGHGVRVSPHCYSGAVALAASVQVTAAFESVSMVELDIRPSALRTALTDRSWRVRDGRLPVPTGPGLGVVLDQEARARYLVAEEEHVLRGVTR